jgi:hypothetical protein
LPPQTPTTLAEPIAVRLNEKILKIGELSRDVSIFQPNSTFAA